MRNAFISEIQEQTKKNDNVMVLVGDIGTFLYRHYLKEFPENFLNMGIAEANMLGVASGLAMSGKIPFVYSITPFVTARAFEQVKIDVCYNNANVKIVGVGSGVSYASLGCTHHSLEDIGIFSTLPNMTILSPSDATEAQEATIAAVAHEGPVYLRIAAQRDDLPYEKTPFKIGKARMVREGEKVAIFATGDTVKEAIDAADMLKEDGVNAYVVNFHTIKPLDKDLVIEMSEKCDLILTVEEHSTIGGLGSAVSSVIAQSPKAKSTQMILGFDDVFCRDYSKSKGELFDKYGISAAAIHSKIKNFLDR